MNIDIRQIMARAIQSWARRNMWSNFGYPLQIDLEQYWLRYRRDGIGSRVIRSYPDACWRVLPQVEDAQGSSSVNGDNHSPFVEEFEEFADNFNIISYMRRADRLSRVGHYSILLLGFEGGDDLNVPMTGQADLAYLSVYSERSAKVVQWEEDKSNPRYGLPTVYRVTPARDQSSSTMRSKGSFDVHHTRVIHVAENLDEDETFGEPALRPIWNNLLDLEKVVGSGAETFWLNARGGLSVEANADTKMTESVIKDMKQQMEDYSNELRRNLALAGAKVSSIQTTIADPKPNAELNLNIISGQTGIPTRILLGSERGELASTQDASSWEARVDERCNLHCNPNIFRPFVDRMIETGNLSTPSDYWKATWPAANTMSDLQKAELAYKKIQSVAEYTNSNADTILSPEEFRPWIDLDPTSEYDLEDDDNDDDTLGDDLPPILPAPEEEDPNDAS